MKSMVTILHCSPLFKSVHQVDILAQYPCQRKVSYKDEKH